MGDERRAGPPRYPSALLNSHLFFYHRENVYLDGASEEILGRAIRDFAKRDEVVIATKVFSKMRNEPNGRGLSRKAIFTRDPDASLKGSAPIMSISIKPTARTHQTPIQETLEALHDVVKSGRVRYIGASSMYAWQFSKALYTGGPSLGGTRSVSMQPAIQPRLSRRGAGDDSALHGPGSRGDSVVSAGARLPPGNRKREGGGETTRSKSDPFAGQLYFQEDDFTVVDRLTEVA